MFILVAALSLAALAQPVAAQAGSIDTIVAVTPDTRLRVDLAAGRIEVTTWERGAVRVLAKNASGVTSRVELTDHVVNVIASARGGRIAETEYTITVPRSMAMSLGSGDVTISVSGSASEILARNYSGTITIRGGRGTVSARSTLGEVWVSDVEGNVTAQSLNAPVHVADTRGDVDVEGSSSHLYLSNIDSKHLSASTVAGVLWFSGPFRPDGHYAFTTHMGSVFISTPDPVNATVDFSTVRGVFTSLLKYDRQETTRRGRILARFGTGAADVNVQTFSGPVVFKHPDANDRK